MVLQCEVYTHFLSPSCSIFGRTWKPWRLCPFTAESYFFYSKDRKTKTNEQPVILQNVGPSFYFPLVISSSGAEIQKKAWDSPILFLENNLKAFFTVLVLILNILQPWFLSKLYLLITANCHTLSVFTCGNYNEQLHYTKTHLTDFRLMGMANKCAPAFNEHYLCSLEISSQKSKCGFDSWNRNSTRALFY